VIDLLFSIALFAVTVVVSCAYAARARTVSSGPTPIPRPDVAGRARPQATRWASIGTWALQPMVRALARAGVHPNAISWSSLALGIAAGSAIGLGHFGVGAALSLASTACDALDGRVARETGSASQLGAVLDAAIDRYAELSVLGGIALALRHNVSMLILSLAATAGTIMVSYASAKAEALGVDASKASMHHRERALTLALAVAMVPIAAALCVPTGAPMWLARLPLAGALTFIAIVANASAIGRLVAVARAVRLTHSARTVHKRPNGATEVAANGHARASDALH
jgi:phosphatidylglycerophosphate synthase